MAELVLVCAWEMLFGLAGLSQLGMDLGLEGESQWERLEWVE